MASPVLSSDADRPEVQLLRRRKAQTNIKSEIRTKDKKYEKHQRIPRPSLRRAKTNAKSVQFTLWYEKDIRGELRTVSFWIWFLFMFSLSFYLGPLGVLLTGVTSMLTFCSIIDSLESYILYMQSGILNEEDFRMIYSTIEVFATICRTSQGSRVCMVQLYSLILQEVKTLAERPKDLRRLLRFFRTNFVHAINEECELLNIPGFPTSLKLCRRCQRKGHEIPKYLVD